MYQKTTNSIKWSALTVIVPKIISPIVMIALARILAPESFGLIATAMIVISFSQMFWEAGLSRALIQTNEPIIKIANVVFWSNIGLGLLIYILIFFAAPLISIYLNSPQSILVLRILSLQIIIMSFTTVQEALFTKELDFRVLFWARINSSVLSGLCSIILALYGLNVWSLVFGTLLNTLVYLFLIWVKSNWRPNLQIDWLLAPKLFRYGSWIVLLSIMGWFINWFDALLVGRYLGLSDLGIYRTGVTMISMLFPIIMGPIATVMFPSFSKLQNDTIKIAKYFYDVNKLIIFFVIPMAVGLFLVSKDFVPIVFGDKWKGLEIVIGILGLSEGLASCVGINPIIYQALGKPDIQTKLSLFLFPVFIVTYLIVAPLGILPLVLAKLGLTILTLPINMIPIVKVLKISPFYILHQIKYIFISTIILIVSILTLQWILMYYNISNHLIALSGSILVGIISYITALWILDRLFLLNIHALFKSVLQNNQ